jgi:hypothetical protein
MYDFKPGDQVQVDPALVTGKARVGRGVGVVKEVRRAGTETRVVWSDENNTYGEWTPTHDLVPAGGAL